ncbi:unnamed protein product [Leptidea sinapis]|uniref:Uncharacterized protein n=1 Tax=Leptidea sinapis TaxID=189913 RepID=A0A5E4QJL2_9NEOP|nr:unnamed protein product [Leptidea sinapis]
MVAIEFFIYQDTPLPPSPRRPRFDARLAVQCNAAISSHRSKGLARICLFTLFWPRIIKLDISIFFVNRIKPVHINVSVSNQATVYFEELEPWKPLKANKQ